MIDQTLKGQKAQIEEKRIASENNKLLKAKELEEINNSLELEERERRLEQNLKIGKTLKYKDEITEQIKSKAEKSLLSKNSDENSKTKSEFLSNLVNKVKSQDKEVARKIFLENKKIQEEAYQISKSLEDENTRIDLKNIAESERVKEMNKEKKKIINLEVLKRSKISEKTSNNLENIKDKSKISYLDKLENDKDLITLNILEADKCRIEEKKLCKTCFNF